MKMCEDNKFHFQWKIKNLLFAPQKTGEPIESPKFAVNILDDTEWFISVYPKGKEDEEYVGIFLTRYSEGVKIPVIFTIELETVDSSRQERRTSPKSIFEGGTTLGFEQFIKRKTLFNDRRRKFLPDDVLTIHCALERASSEVEYVTEYIAETSSVSFEEEFTWEVENWSEFLRSVDKKVECAGEHKAIFQLRICKSSNKIMLEVVKCEPACDAFVRCDTFVLDTPGSEVPFRSTRHSFLNGLQTVSAHLFDREEIKDSYLKDDVLRLRCILNVKIDGVCENITKKIHQLPIEEDLDEYIDEKFIQDYENMFLNGNFSDVKVNAGGKVIKCHKNILYARSSVMSDLLDKAEPASDGSVIIDIDDLDGDTLEKMIYFMYTDKINSLNHTMALKLFVAGHKYEVKYLKQKCSSYFQTAFSFENIYDILVAAHLYEDGDLKRQAISYISEYFSRICITTEWANFREKERELSAYTCKEIRRIQRK